MRRRSKGPDLRTPEEIAIAEAVRVELAAMRQERRQRERQAQSSLPGADGTPAWLPRPGPPQRGVRADPNRDRCQHGLSTFLTDRERAEFRHHHEHLGAAMTASTVVRFMICEYLHRHRNKAADGASFQLDLKALDWRSWRKEADPADVKNAGLDPPALPGLPLGN